MVDAADVESTKQRRAKRKIIDSPEILVRDWAFHVPIPAFFDALDIIRSERITREELPDGKVNKHKSYHWTQGNPPQYNFTIGDIFHAPVSAANTTWGDPSRTHTIQVLNLSEKLLLIEIYFLRGGVTTQKEQREVSQEQLFKILVNGLDK